VTHDPDTPDDPDLQAALRLNALNRFTKRSPQLVLEVHSACEVPAGCGGVVLQWRDRHGSAAMTLYSAWVGDMTVFLDDDELDSSRVMLDEGEHRLLFQLKTGGMQGGLFAAALVRAEDSDAVHATGTGFWRGRKRGMLGKFGDWRVLTIADRDPETLSDNHRWWFQSVVDQGGMLVDIPFRGGEVETVFSYYGASLQPEGAQEE